MRSVLLFLVLAAGLRAQIGIKGGLPLNDIVDTVQDDPARFASDTKRYTVGPFFRLGLPFRLAVEVDALYKRFEYSAPLGFVPSIPQAFRAKSDAWEFPVLLQYRFSNGTTRPFVVTGASFRQFLNLARVGSFVTGPATPIDELDTNSNVGFVVGGGVEWDLGLIKLGPEIRFTRWGVENFRTGVQNIFRTQQSQASTLR